MMARAIAKNLKVTPRKMGEVAQLVYGRNVEDALTILEHTPRKAAAVLHKVIKSAQANAENNHNASGELRISRLLVTPGPVLKRGRPGGQLHFHRINRRMSHVRVEVESAAPEQPAKQPAAASGATSNKGEK